MRSIILTICIGLFCLGIAVPTCGQKKMTLGFEGLPDLSKDPKIFGVEFANATVRTCGGSLNCAVFPPFSGSHVIVGDGSIGAIFHGALRGNVKKVSARVTGRNNVTMTALSSEIQGQVLGTAQTGGANFVGSNTGIPPNKLLEISSVAPINFVTFSGTGNTVTVDDFTFEGSLKSVVIDPGLGQLLKNGVPTFQRDPSPTFQLIADILTLEMSNFVRGHLQADGILVYQTRTTNLAPFAPPDCGNPCNADLWKRLRWAEKQEPDLLVSVHTNAANPEQKGFERANGSESFHSDLAPAPNSKALAQCVLSRVVALGLRDRGVKQKNWIILRSANMPSTLIATAFHTNSQLAKKQGQTVTDEQRLSNPFFRASIAEAIFTGIKDYYADIEK